MQQSGASRWSSGVLALLALATLLSAPEARGATLTYDMIFACDKLCTTGVDEPTGGFEIDEADLVPDGLVTPTWITVSFQGTDWMSPGGPGQSTVSGPAVAFTAGEVSGVGWRQVNFSSAPCGICLFNVDLDGSWVIGDLAPTPNLGLGSGSMIVARQAAAAIPEPSATTLFVAGMALVAARIRTRA